MVTVIEAIAPVQPLPAYPVIVTQITYELPTGNPDTVVFVISAVINDVSCVLVSLVTTNQEIINSDHDDNGVVLIEHTISENFLRRTYILSEMTTPNLNIANHAVMAVYNIVNPIVRN